MRYVLKDDGYPWRVIYCKGKKVGRVWQHAQTKHWHGELGTHKSESDTCNAAFSVVAAKALGFKSVESLRANNAAARRAKRNSARAYDLLLDHYMHVPLEQQMKLLDRLDKPELLTGFLQSFTRHLRK